MISHGIMPEIEYYRRLKSIGISEEYFYSLPFELQKAIIMAGVSDDCTKNKIEFRKKMALKQYDFEEKTKEKVLMLLKKRK